MVFRGKIVTTFCKKSSLFRAEITYLFMTNRNEELVATLDTLIEVVTERLAELREVPPPADEYYKVRLGLAFLVGMRDRAL